jgi:hypothetical protein
MQETALPILETPEESATTAEHTDAPTAPAVLEETLLEEAIAPVPAAKPSVEPVQIPAVEEAESRASRGVAHTTSIDGVCHLENIFQPSFSSAR